MNERKKFLVMFYHPDIFKTYLKEFSGYIIKTEKITFFAFYNNINNCWSAVDLNTGCSFQQSRKLSNLISNVCVIADSHILKSQSDEYNHLKQRYNLLLNDYKNNTKKPANK